MTITSISTGFLTGNLFPTTEGINVKASVANYAVAIEARIKSTYPGVVVSVDWQDAGGVTPSPLKTRVRFAEDSASEDFDMREEENAIEDIDLLCARVWEEGNWIVEA